MGILPSLVAGGLLLGAVPSIAHHSFAAEFDPSKRMTIQGRVTKIEWSNPHTSFYVEVQDRNGRIEKWAFELASPNALARRGWNRESLKVGDLVTVIAYRARGDANVASARRVVWAQGREVFAGSPGDGGPTR
jgi:hypothetical protein